LNLRGVIDVKQREVLTDEPSVPEPIYFDVENCVDKVKGISYQVLVKFRQNLSRQGVTLGSGIHRLINSVWN